MLTNIKVENYKEVNRALAQKLWSGDAGLLKQASDAFTGFVRTYLREQGILRRAMGFEIVGPDDIDRVDWTDNPVKILEFQVDSTAYSVPFSGNGQLRRYQGKRAVVEFTNYETDMFHIEKQRLLTYRHPVQQVLIDQGILDLQRAEDESFINALDTIAEQEGKYIEIATGGELTWDALVEAEKAFHSSRPANRQIPLATIVVSHVTFADLKKLPANSFFAPNFNEQVVNGVIPAIGGYNWVVTNKIDLVPPGTLYLLTSKEFLGGFYLLQDATVYMKTEKNVLYWSVYETAGIGVVTDGILKVKLT
jgi:hypothetical protein